LAWRLLNQYLLRTGDYAGLALFNFYRVYRALVRAKIASLSGAGPLESLDKPAQAEFRRYFDYACQAAAQPSAPRLILMRGAAGSGKSWLSTRLADRLGAVRLVSDVERKRLFGYAAEDKTQAEIYTPEATGKTYAHLLALTDALLQAGLTVMVDAAFLRRADRRACQALARARGAGFLILDMQAPPALLHERIQQRLARGDDPSEANPAVLERQLADAEKLEGEEPAWAVSSASQVDVDALAARIKHLGAS
jgi:predicted kinase